MYTTVTFVLLALMILVLTVWVLLLELRLARLFRGNKVRSLEETFAETRADIDGLAHEIDDMHRTLENVDTRLTRKVETVRTLRFNPFQGTGGNHSFASAFVDERGDGVVLSTLYSREKVSVFAKPVKQGRSEIELTEEEEKVLRSR